MGRPREFDPEYVLARALEVFWQKGFDGTSFTDLVSCTGILASSLYGAFGDKEALFLQVLDYYEKKHLGFIADSLRQSTCRAVAEMLLRSYVKLLAGTNGPLGCFRTNTCVTGSSKAARIQIEALKRKRLTEEALCKRFNIADETLPRYLPAHECARYVMTVSDGLAVQAIAGASTRELTCAAMTALNIFR